MKTSTSDKRKFFFSLLSIVIWIVIWYILSLIVGEEIFLPSPLATLEALLRLIPHQSFRLSIVFTLSRVTAGILISFILGVVLAVAVSFIKWLEVFLSPLIKAMRSIPVASIIILALLWVKSRNLSLLISFLMVFPIIYSSVLSGMKATSPLLLEAASNYGVGIKKRIRYIYMPSLFPFVRTGLINSVGLGFKSAIAAEVIALPDTSIGNALYEAKVYLLTPDLFAWTIVIVLLSVLFEKITLFILKAAERRILK